MYAVKSMDHEAMELPQNATKDNLRTLVWEHMMKNKIYAFPRPFGRIPNFKGAYQAASHLSNLEEFKLAKAVEVNPDKSLEFSRILTLQSGKELYVPVPRLKKSLLKKIIMIDGVSNKKLVSLWGIQNTGISVGLEEEIHIDLIIVGSVAVSKEGYRIGKGKGYADLEFAILSEMKAVDENTPIVTIVHDSQVFDELPKDLFQKHDVPVDYILTPTKIIKVEKELPKPKGVFWDLISQRQLHHIEVLRKLKAKYESEGKVITICNEIESIPRRSEKKSRKGKIKSLGGLSDTGKNKFDQSVNTDVKQSSSTNSNVTKSTDENPQISSPKRKLPIDFSLLVGNIGSDVRVKDLKKALAQNDVKPESITWRGYRGFCYLHYSIQNNERNQERREPFSIDNVIEIIQGMKITPNCKQNLTVKVMEPITRIETTDVTAV